MKSVTINPTIELLEEYGLVGEAQIDKRLSEMSPSQLNKLRKSLGASLQIDDKLASDPSFFNFLASSSFRGDRCCVRPSCRLKKSETVGSFAALYAERMYLPIMLGPSQKADRNILEGSLKSLDRQRPLIDAGIVIPINDRVQLCEECASKLALANGHLSESIADLALKHADKFRVSAHIMRRKDSSKLLSFVYEGPMEYLEEGKHVIVVDTIPEWANDLAAGLTELERSVVIEKQLLYPIIEPSSRDFLVQTYFGQELNTTYLTDLLCEAEYFETVRSQKLKTRESQIVAELSHSIPLFEGLSLATLVSLRNDEYLAFRNYRNAVSAAVRSSTDMDGPPALVARRIYDEQIRPEVESLEAKASNLRSKNRKSLASRALTGGALLSVGLLGHSMPESVRHALEILGACPLVKDVILPKQSQRDDLEVRNSAFYFLLKAGEEQRRQSAYRE